MRWCLYIFLFIVQLHNYWTDGTEILHKAGWYTYEEVYFIYTGSLHLCNRFKMVAVWMTNS